MDDPPRRQAIRIPWWPQTGQDKAHNTNEVRAIRTQCWNNALNAYATSYIFQRRAQTLKSRLQLITYIGFAVPMIVGLLVLSYGHFKSFEVIVAVAAAIGIGQAVFSLWSIIGGWVDGYSYAVASIAENSKLANRFTELASNPPEDLSELRVEYEKLEIQDETRQEQDYQQEIKESEKRMGMRAALRKYQRRCAGCNEIPTTMKPTTCGVCGDFRYRNR